MSQNQAKAQSLTRSWKFLSWRALGSIWFMNTKHVGGLYLSQENSGRFPQSWGTVAAVSHTLPAAPEEAIWH
jgi:hypothetical protein